MNFIRLFYKNLTGQKITEDEYNNYINNDKQRYKNNTDIILEDLENERGEVKKMIFNLKNGNDPLIFNNQNDLDGGEGGVKRVHESNEKSVTQDSSTQVEEISQENAGDENKMFFHPRKKSRQAVIEDHKINQVTQNSSTQVKEISQENADDKSEIFTSPNEEHSEEVEDNEINKIKSRSFYNFLFNPDYNPYEDETIQKYLSNKKGSENAETGVQEDSYMSVENGDNEMLGCEYEQSEPIQQSQQDQQNIKEDEEENNHKDSTISLLSDSLIIDSIEKVQNIIRDALNSLSSNDNPKSLLSTFKEE